MNDLLDAVRPRDWQNPAGEGTYNLVVVGGGTAGLVAAMGGAGLGARVALVERHRLGGDCLHTGCVPSKALLRSAHAVGELRRAGELGVEVQGLRVDFERVMRRMRARQGRLAAHDSADRLRQAGVDVFFGEARFTSGHTLGVGARELRFRRAVVATGGRPATPPIPGLIDTPFLTNETVFDLTVLPKHLIVLGAGPVGCELAQAFARLGAEVTLVGRSRQVLPREAPDASAVLERSLARDGVRLMLGTDVTRIEATPPTAGLGGRRVRLHVAAAADGAPRAYEADALLVATGRRPNVEDLSLDLAGVSWTDRGVVVDDRMRTTNPRIYAAGDVCSTLQFTHAADAQSRLVLQNALFFGRRRASSVVIPWVTYTDPEIAHVGVTHDDPAVERGQVQTITIPLTDVDRAVVDDATDGFVRVYHTRGRLRGCTIVAPHAGEMIGEATFAMTHGGTLRDLSSTVHAYPTQADALKRAGDAYRRQSLTPGLLRWLQRYFRWIR